MSGRERSAPRPRRLHPVLGPAIALAFGAACGERASSRAAAPVPGPTSSPLLSVVSPADVDGAVAGGPPAPGHGWRDLVRDAQWDAAWRELEALPESDKQTPEMRYLRARVELARGEAAVALSLLEGLEVALPLLAADVGRRRAEAKLAAGPFNEAGEWYAARAAPAAQLDAARAFEKANDARRARLALERVLASDKSARAQDAEARAIRIRLAAPPGEVERADARWLAVHGADLPAASEALAALARLGPSHPLSADELMTRARVLVEIGRSDDALHTLDMVANARGVQRLTRAERFHVRGMALFKARGRGGEAAKVLSEAAAAGGATAAEDAFLAARALSRADRDEDAMVSYLDVQKRYPKSPWAEQAAYFVPYLKMLHADWRECARGYDQYLRTYPAGEHTAETRADGALCKLLDGQVKPARAFLERLVEDEPDPMVSARMANLAALAALRDGDRTHAVARWTDVALSRPLTWPALVARARLAEAGAALLPAMAVTDAGVDPEPPPLALALPPPADMLERLGLDEDAETAIRERESAVTSAAGPRASEALCTVYGLLDRARRRFAVAQSIPSSVLASPPTPRTRWAWNCAFPEPYAEAVHDAERRESLPTGLLWAVMRQESAFDPGALSPARAVGLMQLLPETSRSLADDVGLVHDEARLTSPSYSIRLGARAIRRLLDEFHGSVPLALAAYNAGAAPVQRWIARAPGMQIDTFVEHIPYRETRDYVVRVMSNFARYAYLVGGERGLPAIALGL